MVVDVWFNDGIAHYFIFIVLTSHRFVPKVIRFCMGGLFL
jgi:hypothetical protein